ncbi:MAG TPA: AraC family transcriptional regulator [Aeromicrobium sp.]|nr:AraC family transcriptional regulator [Aeromicrobium sp.]
MSVVEWFDRPAVPVAYGLHIAEVAASFGVGPELFDAAGIAPDAIADPDGRLTAMQAGSLLLRGMELTGEPGFGYEIGLRSSLTSHGVMAFGLLTSATLRDAIELGVEYGHVRLPMLQLQLVEDGVQAGVDVQQTFPVGAVRQCLFDLFLVGLARMTPALTGRAMDTVELWFEGPEPEHFARYRDRLPPARFGTGVNQIRFAAEFLDLPFDTANEVASQVAQQQLAGELTRIGLSGEDLLGRVRAQLAAGGSFALIDVARAMHVSPRTLKRRLSEHGVTFHALVSDLRRAEAMRLLRHSVLTVEQIGAQLGYSDAGNFCRAFKRWTGTTPGAFRRGQESGATASISRMR